MYCMRARELQMHRLRGLFNIGRIVLGSDPSLLYMESSDYAYSYVWTYPNAYLGVTALRVYNIVYSIVLIIVFFCCYLYRK